MDLYDDFTLPDGTPGPSLDINNLESLHNSFGMKCNSNIYFKNLIQNNMQIMSAGSVDDKFDPYKGKSLFYHENGRSSNFFYDATFQPIFDVRPLLPAN